MNFHYSIYFFRYTKFSRINTLEYTQLLIGVDVFTEYYLNDN